MSEQENLREINRMLRQKGLRIERSSSGYWFRIYKLSGSEVVGEFTIEEWEKVMKLCREKDKGEVL